MPNNVHLSRNLVGTVEDKLFFTVFEGSYRPPHQRQAHVLPSPHSRGTLTKIWVQEMTIVENYQCTWYCCQNYKYKSPVNARNGLSYNSSFDFWDFGTRDFVNKYVILFVRADFSVDRKSMENCESSGENAHGSGVNSFLCALLIDVKPHPWVSDWYDCCPLWQLVVAWFATHDYALHHAFHAAWTVDVISSYVGVCLPIYDWGNTIRPITAFFTAIYYYYIKHQS